MRRVSVRRVLEVQQDVAATLKTLSALDARDPRHGVLMDQYTELLALRLEVERAEMSTRRPR
jgi:hypothetical protein